MKTTKIEETSDDFYKCLSCNLYSAKTRHTNFCSSCGAKIIWEEENKGYWEPEEGETYFIIYENGNIRPWGRLEETQYLTMASVGNCFKTKKEAEKELEKRKAIVRVKKYIAEEGLYSSEKEFELLYCDNEKYFYANEIINTIRHYSPIGYFKLLEDANKVIDDCEKDLAIIFEI